MKMRAIRNLRNTEVPIEFTDIWNTFVSMRGMTSVMDERMIIQISGIVKR
jgi:hypothetical protein